MLGIAGQAWHLITAFLLYKFLANALGSTPAESARLFGEWRVVLSVLVWFELFVNSGLVKMTTKAVAEHPDDETRITRAAYLGQFAVAGVTLALMLLLAGPIASAFDDKRAGTLLQIAALDIPVYALFLAASAVLLGRGRFERQAVGWILYATAKLGFVAMLVFAGFSVAGALVGNALASVVGLAVVFVPWGRGEADFGELVRLARQLLVASTPLLFLALLEGLGQSADLWLVSALVANGVLVGYYASATVLAEMPTFLLMGVNRVLFPSVARADSLGDSKGVADFAVHGLRVAIMVTVFAVAVVVATGKQALTVVYQPGFVGAYVPLVLLMMAAVGRGSTFACTEVLLATGRNRLALSLLGGSIALELTLLAVLAPRFGVNGAAAGTAATALATGLLLAVVLRRLLGWRPLATLVRSVVAACMVGVALYVLIPASPDWVGLTVMAVVGYPLAAVAYLGLLRVMREIDASDIAVVRAAMAGQS
jgi:O-antigen/teichoic acid export membrane protein